MKKLLTVVFMQQKKELIAKPKKEDAPSDMAIVTRFAPIFTDNDEIKDIDNMWKFLFREYYG